MEVKAKSLHGHEKVLSIHHVIEHSEGFYVDKDTDGNVLLYECGSPIKFNVAISTRDGFARRRTIHLPSGRLFK